jgi:hypothetical protein
VPDPAPLRDEPPLPDDAIVVRGGEMKNESLETAAGTNFDEFGEYAISVFSEVGLTARQIHEKYIVHRKARVSRAGRLRGLGYELKPTHGPGHYDLVLPNPPSITEWDNLRGAFDVWIERAKED